MPTALSAKPKSHDTGWPRFTVSQRTHSSDQSHRIYIQVQGGIDSHDARGADWEGVQYRPLKICHNPWENLPLDQEGGEFEAPNSPPKRTRNG